MMGSSYLFHSGRSHMTLMFKSLLIALEAVDSECEAIILEWNNDAINRSPSHKLGDCEWVNLTNGDGLDDTEQSLLDPPKA